MTQVTIKNFMFVSYDAQLTVQIPDNNVVIVEKGYFKVKYPVPTEITQGDINKAWEKLKRIVTVPEDWQLSKQWAIVA